MAKSEGEFEFQLKKINWLNQSENLFNEKVFWCYFKNNACLVFNKTIFFC